jgi:hypothetical protein
VTSLKRIGIVLLAVVLGFSLSGTLAGAKKRHKRPGFGTKVTLTHPSETQFAGSVRSKLKGCRNQRLVNVYYTDPFTGQTQPISVQRTKKFGKYRVDLPHPAYGGTYQTVAPKVRKRGTLLCRAGKSNLVIVPPAPQVP